MLDLKANTFWKTDIHYKLLSQRKGSLFLMKNPNYRKEIASIAKQNEVLFFRKIESALEPHAEGKFSGSTLASSEMDLLRTFFLRDT